MRNFLTRAFYWRLSIVKGVIGTGIVGASFIVTQLGNTNWDELNTQGMLMLALGAFIAMGKSVEMFLDQTITTVKRNIVADNKGTETEQFFRATDIVSAQPVPAAGKPKDG